MQPYKFGGKELQREAGLDMYDFGARWMDPVVGPRFTTMDPMCEKYYDVSPYTYCGGDPVNRFDPDGRDIVLSGDSLNNHLSLEQIRSAVGEGLNVSFSDMNGHLSYQVTDGYNKDNMPDNALLLMEIIDNHKIIVNMHTTNNNVLDDGRSFYAGAFLGNNVMEDGTVFTNQVINSEQLATMDQFGSPGQNIFHEISGSYRGAQLSLQGVAPSELYNAAHEAATPQTKIYAGYFNFTGNCTDKYIPISNSYKIFVPTQEGMKILYNRDLLIR